MGDKQTYIEKACSEIENSIGSIILSSSFYQTSPWGFESSDEFLNKVIVVKSKIEPNAILKQLLSIENELGRKRDHSNDGYQSRTIDLDILLIDNLVINNDSLIVPHPRMNSRKFVLLPLSEIAGEIIHPVENLSINNLLKICKDTENVTLVF